MERLLPAGVRVAEAFGDLAEARLHPDEVAAVAGAVPSRRREFATTRHLARRAMRDLDLPPSPVPRGSDRAPVWPPGVVGALTHCEGYRAAALARAGTVRAVGIDAEPHAALPPGVASLVLRADEDRAGIDGVHTDRVRFSAKESIFKAWYPLTGRWVDFSRARVVLLPDGRFDAVVDPNLGWPTTVSGRWLVADGLVLTAVVVTDGAAARP